MNEKFIEVDGNNIRYLESGTSENTLVLIHGLGASAERWSEVIPLLSDDFRVVVPDLVGFGHSDKPLVDYTPEFFSEFLEHFFIVSKIKHPVLIGSSLGGQISAEYVSSHPNDVQKLILVSPAGIMKQSTPALDAYIMAALYPNEHSAKNAFELMEGSGNEVDAEIVNAFVSRMKTPNAKLAFMSTLLGLKNSDSLVAKLKMIYPPTLLIWGTDDPVIPINFAKEFVSEIPNCTFFEMDGCGHTPYVQNPYLFTSKVLDFLNSV